MLTYTRRLDIFSSASFLICVFSVLVLLIVNVSLHLRHGLILGYHNMLGWDVLSYYMYLPFIFIYNDPSMINEEVINYIFNTYHPSDTFYQAYIVDTWNRIPAYTTGFAVLFLPFFVLGHLWALVSEFPADGFSFPYQFCIGFGVLGYILPGLFILRKFLLRYFSDNITAWTIILIVFGTNYFHEVINDAVMPHAMVFTGFSLILLWVDDWYIQPTYKTSVYLGLIGGLVLLVRGSEVVILIPALLWKVSSVTELKERFLFWWKFRNQVLVIFFMAFLIFLPQLIYWKIMTGNFIYNSYKNTEGLDLSIPHLREILISFRKSLLIYTPLFAFMIAGIFFLRGKYRPFFLAVSLFTIVNYYFLSCWAAWWNGFSFGMRYFVESWAVMAIPIAAFLDWLSRQVSIYRSFFILLITLCVFLNLFQTWQYVHGILDGSRMTREYYKAVFLKTAVPEDADRLLEFKRSDSGYEEFSNESDYHARTIAYYDFDSLNSTWVDPVYLDSSYSLSGKYSCKLNEGLIFSPTFRIPYEYLTKKDHVWIRVHLNYRMDTSIVDNPVSLVVTMSRYSKVGRENNKYRAVSLENRPFVQGEWNKLVFDYVTPLPLHPKDDLTIYLWHRGKNPFYYDNMRVEAFEMK